jgi:hypothetical protein
MQSDAPLMRLVQLLLIAVVLLAIFAIFGGATPAFAAHCRHGKLYRVSLGVCVSKGSRAAHYARTLPLRPNRVSAKHENSYFVEILIPAGRGATPRVPGQPDGTTPR